MKPMEITKSISITKCRSPNQLCVECLNHIGKGTIAINLHNYNDGLVLKKNVWIHTGCVDKLHTRIKKFLKKNLSRLVVESI